MQSRQNKHLSNEKGGGQLICKGPTSRESPAFLSRLMEIAYRYCISINYEALKYELRLST